MPIELVKERYNGSINVVEIGSSKTAVKIGGETTLPFLFEEGQMPNAPLVALEIQDCEPVEWPDALKSALGDSMKDPVEWAKRCVSEFGAKVLCLKLQSIHPDSEKRPANKAVDMVQKIYASSGVPMVVVGSGDDEVDSDVLPKVSQALKGENILLGIATQTNYKTLTATCLADGHSIIAESPIDVNIAKQLNILIGDMGFDAKRIVMHPTTTSLGYGMEYVYSIMERARLAAFMGDKMLSMPFVLFVGSEVWKVKEAKDFGAAQGINWEVTTAVSLLQAGGDLLVMRHPDAAKTINRYIDIMMGRSAA